MFTTQVAIRLSKEVVRSVLVTLIPPAPWIKFLLSRYWLSHCVCFQSGVPPLKFLLNYFVLRRFTDRVTQSGNAHGKALPRVLTVALLEPALYVGHVDPTNPKFCAHWFSFTLGSNSIRGCGATLSRNPLVDPQVTFVALMALMSIMLSIWRMHSLKFSQVALVSNWDTFS